MSEEKGSLCLDSVMFGVGVTVSLAALVLGVINGDWVWLALSAANATTAKYCLNAARRR